MGAWAQLDLPLGMLGMGPLGALACPRSSQDGAGASLLMGVWAHWTRKRVVSGGLELTWLCPETFMHLGRGSLGHCSLEIAMLCPGSARWGSG